MTTRNFDAIIVGGSFAGLSGALQLARTGRPVCVLDTGKPRNRFADHSHGFFGQDGQSPLDMLARARADLTQYPNVTFLQARAIRAAREDGHFTLHTDTDETLLALKVLLAFGVTDILPELPGLQERWGRTVLHCPYCHGYEVKGQRLGVLNVNSLSVHQALLLADWGPVTFLLNGQAMPDATTMTKFAQRSIQVEPVKVMALEGKVPALSGIRLADNRLCPLDALFLGSKTQLASDLAEQLGCVSEEGPQGTLLTTDAFKQTSVPGVYAAGDIIPRIGNATLAAADGVRAAISMHHSLVFEVLEMLT